MNVEPLKRDYTLPDSELITFTSALAGFMTRDIVEFGGYSITGLEVTAMTNKAQELEDFPSDTEKKAHMMIAVEEKDAVRAQLEVAVRGVSDRALVKWGVNSAYYNQFGVKDLSNKSDNKLLTAARDTVRAGTEYLTSLSGEGLTQIILDALKALADDFEAKLEVVRSKVAARDIATEDRIKLGNELYALVSKYCEIGKIIWKNSSEARYNDYVVYPTEHHGLSKPQNPQAVVDGGDPTHAIVSCDAVQDATSYKLYYSEVTLGSGSGDFTFILDSPTPSFDYQMTLGKRTYWKIRAFSAETSSDYSNEVWLDA